MGVSCLDAQGAEQFSLDFGWIFQVKHCCSASAEELSSVKGTPGDCMGQEYPPGRCGLHGRVLSLSLSLLLAADLGVTQRVLSPQSWTKGFQSCSLLHNNSFLVLSAFTQADNLLLV